MSRSALIVIDVQESFRLRPFWDEAQLPRYRERQLALIAGCRARGVPVVHIFHQGGDGPFSAASGLVRPLDWLPQDADASFTKQVHNAFTDTGLGDWLAARGVTRLIISGIRTEQCCETTARVASDLGYAVDFVTEATLTFAMRHEGSGRVYTPQEIAERTELVLAGRFATVCTVEQALSRLEAGAACTA